MLKLGFVIPSPNKILATRLIPLLVFTKGWILCFAFDLIYVGIISSSIFYLSKLTTFELIITIF